MRYLCRLSGRILYTLIIVAVAANLPSALAWETNAAPSAVATHPLITQHVDDGQRTVLKGNTHPLARPEFDLGTAPATLPMQRMLLVLKRSPQQEAGLEALLGAQQDKSSTSYHQWLTPAQFGQQFGPTDSDIQTITAWLQSHGFQVAGTAQGRNTIEFSGSASQVQEAFHTTIHKYLTNGQQHWANSTDPSIPAALGPAVAGLASLNNFPRQPMNRFVGQFSRKKSTGKIQPVTPLFTYQPSFQCTVDGYCFAVGPYDFATIYNVQPLWNTNINGTGQTIAIVGESNINPTDVASFRTMFGLPANSTANGNPLNIILNGPDPGLQGDESEADIDVQWSGAVAPYATIDFVVSQSTETTSGIDLSAVYIVDNNLAPVMSESYGYCELGLGTAGNQFYNALWQQAAAQGITVFISAGDNGSAGCDAFGVQSPAPAEFGLQVSGYASTPYNVAVGGTDFNEFTNPEAYWSVTNNSTTQASALGYIPETTWNDSCTNALFETLSGLSSNPEVNCNNSQLNDDVPGGGSGGVSACTTPNGTAPANCTGGYAKPSWQTGTGVPNDEKRDIPDVSLFASNGFVGSFYIICQSDQTFGTCNLSSDSYFLGFGGTSVSSPAFAGIMALVNQETGSRQGNANYVFYKLAAKDTLSECNSTASPASSCIFNDVTMGTNAMPCATGSPNCTTSIGGDQYGILTGYNAGTGYDLTTGLGSVNANNLVTQWSSVSSLPSTTTLNSLTPTTITHGQTVNFSVTVKPTSGSGTPTGQISLLGGASNDNGIGAFSLAGGSFSGTTELLPGGTYSVTAHYAGDGTYGASSSSPVSVTVNKENSQPQAFLVTFDSNGNVVNGDTNTAVYGSPYILRVNVENSAGAMCSPVNTTGATACPSGTVTMTDNGTTLDAGTYTLNSYGYFEDLIVQLPGGTNSITAAYAGDNSFNPSTSVAPIIISRGPTTIQQVATTGVAYVGMPTNLITLVQTQSFSNVAPTGTVTFTANGSPLAGTVSFAPLAGIPGVAAIVNVGLPNVTFNAVGPFTIVASYTGDANYAPSSNSTIVPVQGFATNVLSATTLNPQPGAPVTLTALIDTSEKGLPPSGIVVFNESPANYIGYEPIPGNVTYTQMTDAMGNPELQATLSFVPSTFTTSVWAYYTEDQYYSQGSSNTINIVADGNDFTVYPSVPSATASAQGQDAFESIEIVGEASYNGTINFTASSCSGLPAESTCSFSPAGVTGNGSTSLTIQTTAPSAQSAHGFPPGEPAGPAAAAALILGVAFLARTTPRRRRAAILLTLAFTVLLTLLASCGGGNSAGSGGGGGGNSGTPVGNYTVTVTATSGSGSSAITHTTTFQLVVQ